MAIKELNLLRKNQPPKTLYLGFLEGGVRGRDGEDI